jgi:hypothetical protein
MDKEVLACGGQARTSGFYFIAGLGQVASAAEPDMNGVLQTALQSSYACPGLLYSRVPSDGAGGIVWA